MRILLTSYFSLPNLGGLWTYVHELRQGLERSGHEVDLILHASDLEKYYLPNKYQVFEKRKVRELIKNTVLHYFEESDLPVHEEILDIEVERYTMEMAFSFFGLSEYDVIHTQDIISTRAAARVKLPKTPLIATIHGSLTKESDCRGELRHDDSMLREYLVKHEQVGIASSDIAIMPSQWMKNMYANEFQVSENSMQVIPNGMNVESFLRRMNLPLIESRPAGKKIIACNARFDQVKGHVYLFEALAKLKNDHNDWVCWLIGDGELREEYKRMCHQLEINEQVIFLGRRDDVPALLKAADLCVLPSIQENCPYAVMEAQVAGRTIVASDVGGIPEMIQHETTGLLTPPGQSDALFRTLERALAESRLRKELGENAKEWGRKHWSIHHMISRTYHIYEQALKRKKTSNQSRK